MACAESLTRNTLDGSNRTSYSRPASNGNDGQNRSESSTAYRPAIPGVSAFDGEPEDRSVTWSRALHSSAPRFACDNAVRSARGSPVTSIDVRDGLVVSRRTAGPDDPPQDVELVRRTQKAQRSTHVMRRAAPSGRFMSSLRERHGREVEPGRRARKYDRPLCVE